MKQSDVRTIEQWKLRLRNVGRLRSGRFASMVVCGLSLCGVAAFGVHAYNYRALAALVYAERSTALALVETRAGTATVPQGQPSERIEVELITVTPDGFQPKEITRPQGRFVIAIENRSGRQEVSIRLDRQAGGRLIESRMSKEKLNAKYLTDLTPGCYMLTEANHPDLVCRFTITPR